MCHYATFFVIAVFLFVPRQARGLDDLEQALRAEQEALDSLKVALEADRRRLERKAIQKQSLRKTVSRSEQEILQIREERRSLARREDILSGRVGETRAVLESVETRLKAREAAMGNRLREIYKLARGGKMQVLFSARSFSDLSRRVIYLSSIARQDQRDHHAIREDRGEISKLLALRGTQYKHQQGLVEAKKVRETAFRQRLTEHQRNLERVREDEAAMARAVEAREMALSRAEEKLRHLIQEIESRRRRGQRLAALPDFDFEAHRGRLPRPVEGKVMARYGRQQDAKLKTWTFNRGISLAAREGTEVKTVAPGEVVLIDWFPGYGQFVLLRHPGGFYSLYGHLSRVSTSEGEILTSGAVVGAVGVTGRLDNVPQLHFEIMRGEDPLNPDDWLDSRD